MQSYFTPEPEENRVRLDTDDARHLIRVLRAQPKERIAVVFSGRRFEAELEIEGDAAFGRLLGPLPGAEPRCKVTLYQGLPKGDKMDLIVQSCTQLGVHRIVPCQMQRCVGKWESGDKKLQHWQRIAREAAIQAGRSEVPRIEECLSFDRLCRVLDTHEQAMVPWEEGGQTLQTAYLGAADVALVIGPEGGITADEITRMPAQPLTLGPRILRTQIAGMAAITMLLTLSGDME
jgi:16S rRNA (uracil1498-N3)-methyltransferase